MNDEIDIDPYTIPGLKVLLLGASGSGKTHSLVTLIEAGITPFILFTEPGKATLGKVIAEKKINVDQVRTHYIASMSQPFSAMIDMAKDLNRLTFEGITKIIDKNRNKYTQWIDVLRTCENFVDDRTGISYGNISDWGTDRAIVIDSLSGLNLMAMSLIVGGRPTRSMPDWMVAQNNLINFLDKLCVDLNCHFVLTGHLEREQDEVSGAIQLMASTLGKKLAPKISRNFDEVIMAKNASGKFTWSTAEGNADLKARVLKISASLEPSFVPAIEGWKKAGGVITETLELDTTE